MKRMLIYAACASFIFGTALARGVTVSPTFILHGARIVAERREAQLNTAAQEGVAVCTTRYVTTTSGAGSGTTRKSVDCQE